MIAIMTDLAALLPQANLLNPWGSAAQSTFKRGLVNLTRDYMEGQGIINLGYEPFRSTKSIDELDSVILKDMVWKISRQLQVNSVAGMKQFEDTELNEVNDIHRNTEGLPVYRVASSLEVRSQEVKSREIRSRVIRSPRGHPIIPPSVMGQMMMLPSSHRTSPVRYIDQQCYVYSF